MTDAETALPDDGPSILDLIDAAGLSAHDIAAASDLTGAPAEAWAQRADSVDARMAEFERRMSEAESLLIATAEALARAQKLIDGMERRFLRINNG